MPELLRDEVSLFDLWRSLVEGRRRIAVGAVVGMLAAALALALLPPRYEATALIKSASNEPLTRVIERITTASFQDAVLQELNWTDARSILYRASLRAAPVGTLVELKVRATNAADAEHAVVATIEQLESARRDLASAALEKSRDELAGLSAEVRETEALLARLEALGKRIPADNYRDTLSLYRLKTDERNRLRLLRQQEAASALQFAAASTKTATVAGPSVTAQPVFPRAWQAIALGLLGGVFLGAMAVMWSARGPEPRRSAPQQQNS
ncbi:MAG: Wzz/FepE/Etk N-terminal domain-containing protein [Ignavibacteria bacterium]